MYYKIDSFGDLFGFLTATNILGNAIISY